MPSRRQRPAQAVYRHQGSDTTPRDSILDVLDDTLLAYIISFLRWGNRRQLRAVCHRLKALVDQQVTKVEMDFAEFSEGSICLFIKKAAKLWPGTRSVLLQPGNNERANPAIIQALAICDWPKLEIIKLGGYSSTIDCFEALNSATGFPVLRELHFSSSWDSGGLSTNGIKVLSKGLHWANLEVLKIGLVPFGPNGGALLARLSHAMLALRSLSLRQSNMSNAILKDFCEGSWTSLEILDLTFNDLGPESGAILAEASKKWGKLRELDVSCSNLATNGLEHLLEGHWPCLEKLKLDENKLDVGAGALLAVASLQLPCLRELSLSENSVTESGICALLEGHWPLLESLVIYETGAGMGALKAFTAASVRCPKISEICLDQFEGFHLHGIRTLARGTWDSLTKLEVSLYGHSSHLEDVGALASLAPRLPSLKELHLQQCEISDSGLEILLRGQWRGLEVLNLFDNDLTNASAILLAEASLNVLSGIKCLDLVRNKQLKDAGIESLMDGNWPNMETLDISQTGMVGSTGAMAVAAAASRLPSLRKLCADYNYIDEAGSMALLKADWGAMEEIAMLTFTDSTDTHERNAVVQQLTAAANCSGIKLQLWK